MAACKLLLCIVFGAQAVLAVEADGAGAASDAAALNDEGVKLFSEGKHAEALRCFERALQCDPGSREIRTNIGKTHAAIGVTILNDAARIGGVRPAAARAQEPLRLALLHWDGDSDTWHALGYCHLELREIDPACRALERAVDFEGAGYRSWRLLGVAHELAGRLADGERAYERALALKPADSEVAIRLHRLRSDREALASYQVLRSDRCRIHYPESVRADLVLRVRDTLEAICAEMERRWTFRVPGPVVVICYPPGAFSEMTGLAREVGGAFDGKIRVAFPEELPAGGLDLTQVVRHEAIHMMLRALGEAPPRWLDEGLAQILDGDARADWQARWDALRAAEPQVGIWEREARFRDDDPATWVPLYLHAFFFLRHLRDNGQEFRIDMMAREVARGRSWDEAFRGVYSEGADAIDRRFREEAARPAQK